MRILLAFLLSLLLATATLSQSLADDGAASKQERQRMMFFEQHIRPLFVARCYKCHGDKKQKGNLRLDSRAGILQGGESGPAFDADAPEDSLLLDAVRYDSLEMPPDGKLPAKQIELIERWVAMGAPWPKGETAPAPTVVKPKISEEDRKHWAFQPVKRPQPPFAEGDARSQNAIDRFILRRLKKEGLNPSGKASKVTLVRRLFFNVIGLPPSPAEIDAFVRDTRPDAVSKLVDRLLDRPEYGEKWARHWLDLVRYAESDGYKQDAYRPHAWRYRDYVVRSLNNDKPYDQFVKEQLAGDEIAPDDPDALVATGYLRHWIYEYNQRDVRTQWENIINDVTDVTADVFLGMGLGCARCHDHKFDPLLRRDYYRMRAFFAPLSPRDDAPIGNSQELEEFHRKQNEWNKATASIRQQLDEIQRPHVERTRQAAADKFPLDIRPMIMAKPQDRKPLEQQLADMAWRQLRTEVEKIDYAKKLQGDAKDKWTALRKELAAFDHLKPKPLPPALTVSDVGPTAPVNFIPDDRRRTPIPPGFLTILDPSDAKVAAKKHSTGRRAALAEWIANKDNPLTARVIVNRIWQYHFGRGLVETSSDFGALGQPPSHPELLDWLTSEFVAEGWKLKQLHRLILNSATFQQNSLRPAPPIAKRLDPGNRLLWRMNVRRLDAEQIRDALLSASGELKLQQGGPSVVDSALRRSLYSKVMRNHPDAFLSAFDGPDGVFSVSSRNVTTTPTQSLMMINGDWTLKRAHRMAERLQQEESQRDGRITAAFRHTLGRYPSDEELQSANRFLQSQTELIQSQAQDQSQWLQAIPGRKPLAANFNPHGPLNGLRAKSNAKMPGKSFTIEAIVLLRSLYPDATVRTIVSQWDNNKAHAGWALGVTSAKSAYQPRNFILQLIGKNGQGKMTYEVIASNLRPELNKPYYLAVRVNLDETEPNGIQFLMQDLSDPSAKLQTAKVKHTVVAELPSKLDLVLAGRHGSSAHRWDGMIEELKVHNSVLKREQLLITKDAEATKPRGHWQFESLKKLGLDSSQTHPPLALIGQATPQSAERQALVDFCHALLNSNEALYID